MDEAICAIIHTDMEVPQGNSRGAVLQNKNVLF
jgi:hypothetical protein